MKNTKNSGPTIGHVHLTVSNLQRSIKFYELLGFEITTWLGDEAVFLSSEGYHHHIGLNTWAGKNAKKQEPGRTGLYHFAILYSTRKELAKTLQKLMDVNHAIEGFADHGVSEAVYLSDPDGIGVELYWDKPREKWPKSSDGKLVMYTKPLNVKNLLEEI